MSNENQNPNMGKLAKFALIGAGVYLAFNLMSGASPDAVPSTEDGYKAFDQSVMSGEVEHIIERGDTIIGLTRDGKKLVADIPRGVVPYDDFYKRVETYKRQEPEPPSMLFRMLLSFGPMLLMLGVIVYMMKRATGGGAGGMGGFTQDKAKEEKSDVRFSDVAGIDDVLDDAKELVDYLHDPREFTKLGGRAPRGVLLVGPPGTGKTLIAKAIAGEAGVPFFSLSGADFVEMFVGVGSARIRSLFEKARKKAPCIIFVDEFDALARKRGQGMGGGGAEADNTLNSLLVELDGFGEETGIIIIAATNRVDSLDPAAIRPGRFDRQTHVGLPDMVSREKILAVHVRKLQKLGVLDPNIDLRKLARGTPGWSGADLANLVNEASLVAKRNKHKIVTTQDFERAKDKIIMGAERPTLSMSEDDMIATSGHEIGHALVARLLRPLTMPVHKVTIIPRGGALGVTAFLPEGDSTSMRKDQMEAMMAVLLAGRKAEEIMYGEDKISTGASNDMERVTQIASDMVVRYGFSEKLGKRNYAQTQPSYFGGDGRTASPQFSAIIDEEIKAFIDKADRRAGDLITGNIEIFHRMKDALVEFQTIDDNEFEMLFQGDARDQIRKDREAHRIAVTDSAPSNDNDDSGNVPITIVRPRKNGNDAWGPK